MKMSEISEIQKQIHNLELKAKGIELEYQYVTELKNNKILELENTIKDIEPYKEKYEKAIEEIEKYKKELETIKNSRWWKLREKLKGNK